MLNILSSALYAGIGAGIIAGGGYLKKTKKESFSMKKFLSTVCLSTVISLGASFTGMSQDVFTNSAIGVLLGTMVENSLKALFRKESALRVKIGV